MNRFLYGVFVFAGLFCQAIAPTLAQIGGQRSFEFLHLPTQARQIALGGVNVSSYHNDVGMFMANPALLSDSTDLDVGFHFYSFYAGANQSTLALSHTFDKWGTWAFGVQYLNYGTIEGYDATGQPTQTFRAADYALMLAHAHSVNNFTLGGMLKFVNSQIESYQASALFFDVGARFQHPSQDLTVGIAFKNVGVSLSSFDAEPFEMPLDVQIGISFKPNKMPLRLSVTAHQLYQFDIVYQDPTQFNQVDLFGQPIEEEASFADKLARHFVIGGEFVFSKNFNLRVGYNFLQRSELLVEARRGLAGFSMGCMVRLKKFEIAYANSIRHLAGGTHSFSLIIHTRQFKNRKKIIVE